MSEKLANLVDRVWGPPDRSSPVSVTLGSAPADRVVVETYAIVPSLARARFLVPLGSRRAAVGSMWTYHTMRAPTRRVAEATVASLFGVGAGSRVFTERLVVSIDATVPREDYAHWLLLNHLSESMNLPNLFAGMAVRRVQPNSKPILELFDGAGLPQGYAKLGWSAATKRLVRDEAAALSDLSGRLDTVIFPRLLREGRLNDTDYSVVSPLPTGLRRWPADPLRTPELMLAVAGSTPVSRGPLAGSAYAKGLRRELDAWSTAAPDEAGVLNAWLSRLETNDASVPFGRWHGDWTPHNLGRMNQRVAAWDWEHSRTNVPIGFDVLHWHYQRRLSQAGLAAAVLEVASRSAALGALGVPSEARGLVGSLYLLEMFVRSVRLAVGGGGWNPRVYPAMLDVAARSDR